MEASRNTTDAYCQLHFGKNESYKTKTIYNNLEPKWDDALFTYEIIDDEELQETSLQIDVIDEDVFSSDDLIGKVTIDLSSLLSRERDQKIDGWLPIYDVDKGIRGEIQLEIRLVFVRDENIAKHIQSTLVSFFSTISPPIYTVRLVLGFVEELVDFKRSEKEEENMVMIHKGCLRLRKKLGKSVLKRGGNAIIAYRQVLDDEGNKSKKFVVRGFGTAVFILIQGDDDQMSQSNQLKKGYKVQKTNATFMQKLSSKQSDPAHSKKFHYQMQQDEGRQEYEDKSKVQFITSSTFPEEVRMWFGATVSARSVRLLSLKTTERDQWWAELREEVTKNALSINCTHIIGYREIVNIYDNVIVMTVFGTAVKIKDMKRRELYPRPQRPKNTADHSPQFEAVTISRGISSYTQDLKKTKSLKPEKLNTVSSCEFCHVIYQLQGKEKILNKVNLFKCLECDKDYVPEIIMASIDPPEGLAIIGYPKLIETRFVKLKKKAKGEQHAISVSDKVFFIEYHLHSLLLQKMKMMSMNSIFGLRIKLLVAADTIIGVATGTAMCLRALPLPLPLQIKKNPQLYHENEEDSLFFHNLEKLSLFYTDQSMKKDILVIRTPYYFTQEQKKIKKLMQNFKKNSENFGEPMKKSPSKTTVDELQAVVNNDNNVTFRKQTDLALSRIDEELKEPVDHSKVQIKQIKSKILKEDTFSDIKTQEDKLEADNLIPQKSTLDEVIRKLEHENIEMKRPQLSLEENKKQNPLAAAIRVRQRMSADQLDEVSSLPLNTEPSNEKENVRGKITLKNKDFDVAEKVVFYNKNENFKAFPSDNPPRSPHLQHSSNLQHDNYFDIIQDNRELDSVKQPRQHFQQYMGTNIINKASFIIELDDHKDIEILKSFLDPYLPPNVTLLNTKFDLFNYNWQTIDSENIHFFVKACRFSYYEREPTKINQPFNSIMQQAYLELVSEIISQGLAPCVICSLRNQLSINDDKLVDIVFTAAVLKSEQHQMIDLARQEKERLEIRSDISLPKALKDAVDEFGAIHGQDKRIQIDFSTGNKPAVLEKKRKKRSLMSFLRFKSVKKQKRYENKFVQHRSHIKLLPMAVYPRKIIKKYLGLVDVNIIRENPGHQENETTPNVIELVIAELQEIAKARAEALGGNCILGFKVDINKIEHGIQNQLYVNASCFGDVVEVTDEPKNQGQGLFKQSSSAEMMA